MNIVIFIWRAFQYNWQIEICVSVDVTRNNHFSEEIIVSLYLCRLKNWKPVWARLTALIVTDVSEQMESGGKKTPAPYVNAEYVHDRNHYVVQMVYTAHKYMHTVPNPLISHTLRSWSCLTTACSSEPFLCSTFSLSGTSSSVPPLPPPLGSTLLLAHYLPTVCLCATSTSLPFILYLWHFLSANSWQQPHAKIDCLRSSVLSSPIPLTLCCLFYFAHHIW